MSHLAHLTYWTLTRLDVRTGAKDYLRTFLQWSGDRAQGNEIASPVSIVIDVGRAFTMTFDGELYLTGTGKAQYQTFSPTTLLLAARQGWFGFTLLYDEETDVDPDIPIDNEGTVACQPGT